MTTTITTTTAATEATSKRKIRSSTTAATLTAAKTSASSTESTQQTPAAAAAAATTATNSNKSTFGNKYFRNIFASKTSSATSAAAPAASAISTSQQQQSLLNTFSYAPASTSSGSSSNPTSQEQIANILFHHNYQQQRKTSSQALSSSATANRMSQAAAARVDLSACALHQELVRSWILAQAKQFRAKYFAENAGSSQNGAQAANSNKPQSQSNNDSAKGVLERLREASDCISISESGPGNLEPLTRVFSILAENDVSAFEMIHSGLVLKLAAFLKPVSFTPSDVVTKEQARRSVNYAADRRTLHENEKRLVNIKQFLNIFCRLPLEDEISKSSSGTNNESESLHLMNMDVRALSCLVHKLGQCVQQLETFEIRGVHDVPATAGDKNAAIKYFNTHQIKCLLQRYEEGESKSSTAATAAATSSASVVGGLRAWKAGYVKVN